MISPPLDEKWQELYPHIVKAIDDLCVECKIEKNPLFYSVTAKELTDSAYLYYQGKDVVPLGSSAENRSAIKKFLKKFSPLKDLEKEFSSLPLHAKLLIYMKTMKTEKEKFEIWKKQLEGKGVPPDVAEVLAGWTWIRHQVFKNPPEELSATKIDHLAALGFDTPIMIFVICSALMSTTEELKNHSRFKPLANMMNKAEEAGVPLFEAYKRYFEKYIKYPRTFL